MQDLLYSVIAVRHLLPVIREAHAACISSSHVAFECLLLHQSELFALFARVSDDLWTIEAMH
jgi:hypothetical protein